MSVTSKYEFVPALRHLKMVAVGHAVDQDYQVSLVPMALKVPTVLLVEREFKAIAVHPDQKEMLDHEDLTVSIKNRIYSA